MSVLWKKNKNQLSYDIIFGGFPQIPIVAKMKIDKIAFTLKIPPNERTSLDKKLKAMLSGHTFAKPARKMNYRNGFRVYIKDPNNTPVENATFQINTDPWDKTHNYMRVEFNPSKVPTYFIKEHLNILLKDGFSRLINMGRVTVLHEAVDVHFCTLQELYLYYPKIQCSTVNYKGGETISTYLGKTTGEKYFCVYNKTQEIKDTNVNFYHDYSNAGFVKEPEPTYPIMRIEHRRFPKGDTKVIACAQTSPDPFLRLKIYNRFVPENGHNLKTETERTVFKLFKDCCNYKGLQQARLQLTSELRKKYDQILNKTTVKWWKPDKVQAEREIAINSIMAPLKIPKKYEIFYEAVKEYCN